MEQMKISSAFKAYPNKFVLMQAVKRDSSHRVMLANILNVCETKEDAFFQQILFEMIGVKGFVVPTFDTDEALHITLNNEQYNSEPLLSPAENARLFRDYYGL